MTGSRCVSGMAAVHRETLVWRSLLACCACLVVNPFVLCSQMCAGSNKGNSSNKGGLDMAVSATAAVGGLVALTGSLLSYAVARARGNKEKNRLKGAQYVAICISALPFSLPWASICACCASACSAGSTTHEPHELNLPVCSFPRG